MKKADAILVMLTDAPREDIARVIAYAAEHVSDVVVKEDDSFVLPHDEARERSVMFGPCCCVYAHVRLRGEPCRMLVVYSPRGVVEPPPPVLAEVVATLFGFTGEMHEDYQGEPIKCPCGKCTGRALLIQPLSPESDARVNARGGAS